MSDRRDGAQWKVRVLVMAAVTTLVMVGVAGAYHDARWDDAASQFRLPDGSFSDFCMASKGFHRTSGKSHYEYRTPLPEPSPWPPPGNDVVPMTCSFGTTPGVNGPIPQLECRPN